MCRGIHYRVAVTANCGRLVTWLAALALILRPITVVAQNPPATPPATPPDVGRIAGQVTDRATGRPLQFAQLVVEQLAMGAVSDLDGRFLIGRVPVGTRTVSVRLIGYRPIRIDSVIVRSGETTLLNPAMEEARVELSTVVITTAREQRLSSDAGLLAIQKEAAAVSDGISAQAMARTPTSNAAEAISRVTGITVVDDKFVVARGLGERYSNTLLNGSELPSPEPTRRIVPLDIFPASLLESVVTTKSATPDKPADFSGGLVEIRTKEFPEMRTARISVSQGYNTLSTLRDLPIPARRGIDHLGFDAGGRAVPAGAPPQASNASERFAESLRSLWQPPPRRVLPDVGLGADIGDQIALGEERSLGYVMSATYGSSDTYTPNRLFQFSANGIDPPVKGASISEGQSVVDLGAIANLAFRLGATTKLTSKNLYTRNAEETAVRTSGFDNQRSEADIHGYQMRYIVRAFAQTQLAGEHVIAPLGETRIEWKATLAQARREEPDNRQAQYFRTTGTQDYTLQTNNPPSLWFRNLVDDQYSGQLDVHVPLGFGDIRNGVVKVGGLARTKARDFDASYYQIIEGPATEIAEIARALPPDQAFSPEHLGSAFVLRRQPARVQSYTADDDVQAGYAMIDLPVLSFLRIVGGARFERWRLRLVLDPADNLNLEQRVVEASADDILGSGNITVSLTDRMNLRLAAFQAVTRPDARELSPDEYISVTGECASLGNPALRRATSDNADVRWEFYPSAGELFTLGAFYKRFRDPIIETVDLPSGSSCRISYTNAVGATNYGAEAEIRKALTFLPGDLGRLAIGVNVTAVQSTVEIDPEYGVFADDLPLQSQSPLVVNATLGYDDVERGISFTAQGNWFADRIARYGLATQAGESREQPPNVKERGRPSIDAKLQKSFGRTRLSLSGKNLLNEHTEFYQDHSAGRILTGYSPRGVSFSVGATYGF